MNDLIRSAIAAEAEERVDSRTVLAELHKRNARKPFGMIIGVATLTVAAAAAAFIVPTAIKKTEAAPPATSPTAPSTAQNVLLLGLDEVGNTDSIVYARFREDGTVSAVSLPRDVLVGQEKINSLFLADPKKLTSAVEALTDTKVDHYAAIKMSEFGRLSSAVGGVEVCLKAATEDDISGVNLPAGKSILQGKDALAFLRQRRNLPNGDLDRIKRLHAVLSGIAAKVTKDNALPLAREISRSISVDQGWDVLEFAQRFQGPVKIRTTIMPVGTPKDMNPPYEVSPGTGKTYVGKQFADPTPTETGCVN
ncbi:LCP family protein [Lentzea sp. NPDC051213]|uniref:LCP family protein n=1 Tax=Lentzea sp. NPDC051213 TaxID=3364126 RepID=UPI0037A33D49